MGQCYSVVVTQDNERKIYDYPKLMEGAYIDCNGNIEDLILNKPSRVEVVGEYYSEYQHYIEVDRGNHKDLEYKEPLKRKNLCLVNWDKKQILRMEDYISDCTLIKGDYEDIDKEYLIAHPLILLCALGNQRGGGDYGGKDQANVGLWAGDLISYEYINKGQQKTHYRDFFQVEYTFIEYNAYLTFFEKVLKLKGFESDEAFTIAKGIVKYWKLDYFNIISKDSILGVQVVPVEEAPKTTHGILMGDVAIIDNRISDNKDNWADGKGFIKTNIKGVEITVNDLDI